MGLSITASHLVWAVALIGAAGVATNAWFDHAATMEDVGSDRHARIEATVFTNVNGTYCYNAAETLLRMSATNIGRTPLSFSFTTLVADGVPLASVGSWALVDGGTSSDVWQPGQFVSGSLTPVATEPQRLSIVTENGVIQYLDHIVCPYLASIVISPTSVAMTVGGSQTFTATGYDQFGAPVAGLDFVWNATGGSMTELSPTAARFDSSTTSGSYAVTVTADGVNAEAPITLYPDAPVSLTVSPTPVGMAAGGSQAFTATVLDQYGNVNATASVTWSTTIGSITAGGVLTAPTAPTSGTVTATSGAASNAASVTVYAGAPSTVTVSPTPTIVNTTLTRQFTATVRDSYGNVNSTAAVTWSATRGSASATGLYTAPATTGADTVTATSVGVNGAASVSVQKAIHIDSLVMYKANATASSFKRGTDTAEARAIIRDHLGNVVQSVSVSIQWVKPNTVVDHTDTVTSAVNGTASAYWVIPNGETTGVWTARVSAMSGTDYWWDTAADVTTSVTFSVTN